MLLCLKVSTWPEDLRGLLKQMVLGFHTRSCSSWSTAVLHSPGTLWCLAPARGFMRSVSGAAGPGESGVLHGATSRLSQLGSVRSSRNRNVSEESCLSRAWENESWPNHSPGDKYLLLLLDRIQLGLTIRLGNRKTCENKCQRRGICKGW